MPAGRLQQVLHYLRTTTAEAGAPAGASDADLLARYAANDRFVSSTPVPRSRVRQNAGEPTRVLANAATGSGSELLKRSSSCDESAFELLVWRHGGMVLGVCRRLRHEHDAQDAFQATFLALARRARVVGQCASVGAWLHQVAYRAALGIRTRAGQNVRTLPLENAALQSAEPDPCAAAGGQELRRVLEEQLARLPYPFRAVIVLRCLAGKSSAEAAAGAKTLWAAISVNRPVFREGDTETLQLFFTLVNDGNKAIDPKVDSSRIIVNGKALADADFILGNGPRDARLESLPARDHLLFGYALGKRFAQPGVYRVSWEGEGFRSPEIVFRVLPK